MNPPNKKLPAPEVLNRLYWYEGLSQRQIAKRFGAKQPSVFRAMQRYKIPRRKPAQTHRPTGQCVKCGVMVCKIKQWTPAGYVWKASNKCELHQLLWRRQIKREESRRRRGTPESRWIGPRPGKPLHSICVRSE